MRYDKVFDRSKLIESNWQEYDVLPTKEGWYEVKACVGAPFESGKYAWMYWYNKNWYFAKDAFNKMHDKNNLPKHKSYRAGLIDGDKWRGING